ncbi:glycosyltransferase [Microbulbifer sp. SSSA002]|uniref:glycosyltransferase n=1 Tax=unclassified Microbulbifer TaxID=2619833 RepID=UPI00403A0993
MANTCKTKRILFFTMQYGPGYTQGTERYIKNIANGLTDIGYEIIIAAGDPEKKNTHTHNVEPAGKTTLVKIPTKGWSTLDGASVNYYKNLLGEIQPDIIHMVNPAHIGVNALIAARALQLPYFITVTDFWWLCPKHTLTLSNGRFCSGFRKSTECLKCIASTHPNKVIRELSTRNGLKTLTQGAVLSNNLFKFGGITKWPKRNKLLQQILSNAEKVICLSKTGKSRLEDFFKIKNATYLPTGLSSDWFLPPPPERKEKKFFTKIGFLGAIAPHKGVHILVEAISQLACKNVILSVAGKIHDKDYASLLFKSNVNIEYAGEANEKATISFLDSLDLLVIPSTSPENQPQVLLEAGARGIPTISSNSPGCAELLETKLTFPMNDSRSLAHLIQSFLSNPSSFAPPVKPLSIAEVSEKTCNIYSPLKPTLSTTLKNNH